MVEISDERCILMWLVSERAEKVWEMVDLRRLRGGGGGGGGGGGQGFRRS